MHCLDHLDIQSLASDGPSDVHGNAEMFGQPLHDEVLYYVEDGNHLGIMPDRQFQGLADMVRMVMRDKDEIACVDVLV